MASINQNLHTLFNRFQNLKLFTKKWVFFKKMKHDLNNTGYVIDLYYAITSKSLDHFI
jgi:hypothetical protein